MSDRQAWLKENLPVVAGMVDQFAEAFGRENLRVVLAAYESARLGREVELGES